MTIRNLALDVYRYWTRDYNDHASQDRKMRLKWGSDVWTSAAILGIGCALTANRDQCAASVISKIEAALAADDRRMTQTTK